MPVATNEKKAIESLRWLVTEMENRYSLFIKNNVKDIAGYNEYCAILGEEKLPYVLVFVDDLSGLMMTRKKEVEFFVQRLASKARSAGIHLIFATQRPSTDVITSDIKINIPSRIAFAVSSRIDSKSIIDRSGAENLLGKGDMLYFPNYVSEPIRVQGTFVSDSEVEKVANYLKSHQTVCNEKIYASDRESQDIPINRQKLFDEAVEVVIAENIASVSIIQRKLGIGYPRAAKFIDEMEKLHYIGPFQGSSPRKILIKLDEWLEFKSKRNW